MVYLDAGQAHRQRSTPGLLAGLRGCFCHRAERFELKLNGGNVSIERLIEPTGLVCIEQLA